MSETQEKKSFDPLNEGDYLMALKTIEEKKSKAGDQMVTAQFEVVDGDMKGRLIFDNYLVTHKNPDVPEFAKNRVSRFLQAVGVQGGFDEVGNDYSALEEYVGKSFIAGVAYSKPYKNKDGELTIGNRIKSFKAR
jgi:hypothetical protein